ncbi:MAG TPA: GntR family transcriptional regulator [Cycloclasticus sp.]|nr:GntR family transcriptional regulator [Cycloclasticus sp.]HIL92379.1 GntR family transcriptional regulator [Cycloclasticus sp.]
MVKVGHTHQLDVIKALDFGFYLDAKELGEVLLPNKHAPNDLSVGDKLHVFLYLDSEDRPIATTKAPKAKVGEFAYLKCVARTHVGAFLDWGLEKDILVPFAEQHRPMDVDKSYLVYIYLDKNDGRLVASSKIDKYIDDEAPHDFTPQQQVNLIIGNSTDLGFKAIINNSHWGVLYKNDVFQTLSFGQSKKGFIKRIREDGKIDLSLQGGKETRDKYTKIILNYLEKHDGFAPLHDKSSPEIIADTFGMSKGAFKKSIGGLYKQRIISINKDGIRLLDTNS